MKLKTNRQPIQPIQWDGNGVVRFKPNKIVEFMVDELRRLGVDLNKIHEHCCDAPDHDWDQFNMLNGYSVSGHPTRSRFTRFLIDEKAERYIEEFPEDPELGVKHD